ncbi:MAG: methylglyoxal synthase [Firmicutes bacterium]|nr:methylglyoxal synthase [Candidatus Colimorpha enterica]
MQIAIIAGDRKKELMTQFCIAYCGILSNHKICATGTTGRCISEATGLDIECLLSGTLGGVQQICSRVVYEEIDMLLFFRDSYENESLRERTELDLLRLCDIHNIPIATNIATAELLVRALDRGDFGWRDIINPNSEINCKKTETK